MKNFATILGSVTVLLALKLTAGQVYLSFDPSSDTNISGFNIYASKTGGTNFSPSILFSFGNTNKVLCLSTNLTPGTWFFAGTARDASGSESDFSTQVEVTFPTNQLYNLSVESSTNLLNWQEFFRVKIEREIP